MFKGRTVLAVVPARSGSKGVPGKNMRTVDGTSLIGHAGLILQRTPCVDLAMISTDSDEYIAEATRFGLTALFKRPEALSTDTASAIDTMQHALREAEAATRRVFDIILIIEPTSPLRTAADIESCVDRLVSSGCDSVVAVSPVPAKFHPDKLLVASSDGLTYFSAGGRAITGRQQLTVGPVWRNGVCYALTRDCLMVKGAIFTDATQPLVIDHPVVNIDDPWEFAVAEFYWSTVHRPA